MRNKILLSCCIFMVTLLSSTQVSAAFTKPGHRSCHSHYYHPRYHDHAFKNFFRERNKNITDWGAFLDYLCIGPAGAVCGLAGVIKRQDGAAIVMTIGLIETAVEAACLSHYGSQ